MISSVLYTLEDQRRAYFMWAAIAFAGGIGVYFSIKSEPDFQNSVLLFIIGLITLLVLAKYQTIPTLGISLILLISIGYSYSSLRSNFYANPVLKYHYYGAIQGRIIAIDRSGTNRPRLTLDHVVLEKTSPDRTPKYVRVSLHYDTPFVVPKPGHQVMITASLSPPSGPAEPGGFDFQRFAWFKQLGAVGYSRNPLLEFAPPDRSGLNIKLFALRMHLAAGIRARIDGQAGAFAAAILTGDRSALDPVQLDNLRASNLAHLLAISGLHMGLLTGFIFAGLRSVMALFPYIALRWPVKKLAAGGALVMAFAYLALSGANVATQRAFVMVAVMLLAVILDRRAITLRAVAVAALIVLILRPESLISAGFQMSFAATTALVAVFAFLRDKRWFLPTGSPVKSAIRFLIGVLLSSAIAGAATAPFSAYHFNQLSQYGLLANLLSVPVMGLLVMPSAVIGGLLAPLGQDSVPFAVMGAGINWILTVASWIANLDGATTKIAKPNAPVLPMIALGFLFLFLWQGRARVVGVLPVIAALVLWGQSQRPDVLISANGRLLGILGEQGRILNRQKGNGFVARSWLENDGDAADQSHAFQRDGMILSARNNDVLYITHAVLYKSYKTLKDSEVFEACQTHDLVIVPKWQGRVPDCTLITQQDLRKLGAIAVNFTADGVTITGARQKTGTRLWNR